MQKTAVPKIVMTQRFPVDLLQLLILQEHHVHDPLAEAILDSGSKAWGKLQCPKSDALSINVMICGFLRLLSFFQLMEDLDLSSWVPFWSPAYLLPWIRYPGHMPLKLDLSKRRR